ncbi:hypothetical protein [Nocardia abscessus]|uniref:hypothetical protein n=1 Tax=Nocardia abscessus TaxID=120957 RepID=UPI002458EF68|nr:hypothetical protein [Nocardia abscessus]
MRVRVIRPDDLLVCVVEFVNLVIEGFAPNRQLVARRGTDARVIVHLPPQRVAEKAYRQDAAPSDYVHVPSRIAGPSRLVFRVPTDRNFRIDYKLEAILELLTPCRLAIAANAVKDPGTEGGLWFLRGLWFFLFPLAVSQPGTDETAIEVPLRLILSPVEEACFAHAVEPATNRSGTASSCGIGGCRPDQEPVAGARTKPVVAEIFIGLPNGTVSR